MGEGRGVWMEVINALSIDLEDWYHPELVRRNVGSISGLSD